MENSVKNKQLKVLMTGILIIFLTLNAVVVETNLLSNLRVNSYSNYPLSKYKYLNIPSIR